MTSAAVGHKHNCYRVVLQLYNVYDGSFEPMDGAILWEKGIHICIYSLNSWTLCHIYMWQRQWWAWIGSNIYKWTLNIIYLSMNQIYGCSLGNKPSAGVSPFIDMLIAALHLLIWIMPNAHAQRVACGLTAFTPSNFILLEIYTWWYMQADVINGVLRDA